MARKKKPEQSAPGSPAWMATFSDLMNLLLCFFVILFSMSSIDVAKYEEVASSLSKSFSIFSGGKASIGEGQLISSGVSQLNDLDKYYNEVGKASEENEVSDGDPMKEYKEQLKEEKKTEVEKLYEKVTELTENKKLDDQVNVTIDKNYSYICLTLNGSILFNSGSAEIVDSAVPILSRIGDILKLYDDNIIKIEGHTDNVPIKNSSKYTSNWELSSARATSVCMYMIEKKKVNPSTLEPSGRSEYDPIASNNTTEGRAKNRRVEIKIYSNEEK